MLHRATKGNIGRTWSKDLRGTLIDHLPPIGATWTIQWPVRETDLHPVFSAPRISSRSPNSPSERSKDGTGENKKRSQRGPTETSTEEKKSRVCELPNYRSLSRW